MDQQKAAICFAGDIGVLQLQQPELVGALEKGLEGWMVDGRWWMGLAAGIG